MASAKSDDATHSLKQQQLRDNDDNDRSLAGDVAGGFARALLRAQGQLISSLGLQASGVLHLPRGIPTKQLVKQLDQITNAFDYASTVRNQKHEEHRSVWASVKAEFRARGLYGVGQRFLAPLGRQSALGTVLFASYETLLSMLDEPPAEDDDAVRLCVWRETAPVIAGLGAGLLHGFTASAMAALPGSHGKTWTVRRFARRRAALRDANRFFVFELFPALLRSPSLARAYSTDVTL